MFEKDLREGDLLDVYRDVLSERRRGVLEMYYDEDFSLSEIAEQIGISRQGVRDLIKKGEEELAFLEEKLGLAATFAAIRESTDRLLSLTAGGDIPAPVRDEVRKISDLLK